MKQTDINRNKMTGEYMKHIRRKWRKVLNKKRRCFLKKNQNEIIQQDNV